MNKSQIASKVPRGTLVMIPSLLGKGATVDTLPKQVRSYVDKIDYYIVEREKTARQFVKTISPEKSQSGLKIHELDKNRPEKNLSEFLRPCERGITIGVLSDVGCPGVADPGALVVRLAHRKGIRVTALAGPSSILISLMGSGMNGQKFVFHGYLPINKKERSTTIKQLENTFINSQQTQIFIETPYRNETLYKDLIRLLKPHTRLCIATNITLPDESILTKSISEWRKSTPELHKKPTVFLIGN